MLGFVTIILIYGFIKTMPTINHKNFGDVQEHEYLHGVILKVYPEEKDTPEAYWDTADVYIEEMGINWSNAPVFYHCTPDQIIRPNGAVISGARGFTVNDRVILLCRIQTAKLGSQVVSDVKVIGHEDGIRKCAYNYVVVRACFSQLEPVEVENQEANLDEYCTVFDILSGKPASIADQDALGQLIQFPCPVSKIKPFLKWAELIGVPLFDQFPQGDDQLQIAGVIPNWKTDVQGNDIRGGASPEVWWTSYNVDANPVQNFFEDMCSAIMLDNEGASTGTYQKAMDLLDKNKPDIETWAIRSSAFRTDERVYDITAPKAEGLSRAVSPSGFPAAQAYSLHIQTAYGEDEIWVCAVNSWQGIIVSYCDAAWKYLRLSFIPPVIEIPGLIGATNKLADAAAIATVAPGAMSGDTLGDLGMMLAGMATLAGKGGENNIWSIGVLKRINEGAFHRTIHPAMAGSYALKTTPIPEDKGNEPAYISAWNRHWDKIKAWYRADNWQNTLDCAYGTFGVNVTWWFNSIAQEWGAESVYLDTPIGSMWLQAPNWKAALWYMPSLTLSTMTARRDMPINQSDQIAAKHSRTAVAQLYVVQRTALTLWAEKDDIFVKQEIGEGPYSSLPPGDDGGDAVSYAKMPDGTMIHVNNMTNDDIEAALSDMIIIRSACNDENPDDVPKNQAFRQNRNEFEVMAAADLYGELMLQHGRRSPADQKRNPDFEREIARLIDSVMATAPNSFLKLYIDIDLV